MPDDTGDLLDRVIESRVSHEPPRMWQVKDPYLVAVYTRAVWQRVTWIESFAVALMSWTAEPVKLA